MSSSTPIRIKFLTRGFSENKYQVWLRQFPKSTPIWGNCHFIFDESCEEYDWLIVYDDLPPAKSERFSKRKEKLRCNPRNTLLVTSEPSTIKVYGSKYVNQFEYVLTTQEPWAIKHKNAIYSQCGYRWFYGIGSDRIKNFDEISTNIPNLKSKTVSTVCSAKKQKNTVHNQRYEFTQELKKNISELDIYGHGVEPIDDKSEAIDQYKYHVVIENVSTKDHWSEKLADAFLGHAIPFYYGCTNVFDYFPENSIVLIDPYDEELSIEIIKKTIESNFYEEHVEEIETARDLILNTYNFFAVVSKVVEEHFSPEKIKATTPFDLRSRHSMRSSNPINFIQYFFERYAVKFRHFLSKRDA